MQTEFAGKYGAGADCLLRARRAAGLRRVALMTGMLLAQVAAGVVPGQAQAQAQGQVHVQESVAGGARQVYATPYGHNLQVGKVASINGARLYYESYGEGPVLLQLHGNDGNIESMSGQIEAFRQQFRVIALDSRGHGKSSMGNGKLSYEQMADDVNALLEQLRLRSVDVLGWSDGGNIGLLLAIRHPDKVARLAIMGANLHPAGAQPWALEWVARQRADALARLASGDTSADWQRSLQLLDLLGKEPNITVADLQKISAPVLVMSGDRDVIRLQHSIEIFEGLRQSNLAVFPGATHFIPLEEPARFNQTVLRFFQGGFGRPDTHDLFR